jgi:hypothetical protein
MSVRSTYLVEVVILSHPMLPGYRCVGERSCGRGGVQTALKAKPAAHTWAYQGQAAPQAKKTQQAQTIQQAKARRVELMAMYARCASLVCVTRSHSAPSVALN